MRKEQNYLCLECKHRWNNIKHMAFISYNKLWESEFDNIVSKKDKIQDINFIQIKLELHDTFRKEEKKTTNLEAVKDEDITNEEFFDKKLWKIDGHLSILEKDYDKIKLLSNIQTVEEILFQRAVKTTKQMFYDKGLFDSVANAVDVSKDFLFVTRRRPDLEKVNDVIQGF